MPLHTYKDQLVAEWKARLGDAGGGPVAFAAIGALVALVLLIGALPAIIGSFVSVVLLLGVAAAVTLTVIALRK